MRLNAIGDNLNYTHSVVPSFGLFAKPNNTVTPRFKRFRIKTNATIFHSQLQSCPDALAAQM